MSVFPILAIASLASAVAVFALFAYQLQWMKKIRLSFPDIDESAFFVALKKHLGSGKIEKKVFAWLDAFFVAVLRVGRWLQAHPAMSKVTSKIKDRADRLLGKNLVIPERETSSVFLKNISAYKKKMQESREGETEEKIDKQENMPG